WIMATSPSPGSRPAATACASSRAGSRRCARGRPRAARCSRRGPGSGGSAPSSSCRAGAACGSRRRPRPSCPWRSTPRRPRAPCARRVGTTSPWWWTQPSGVLLTGGGQLLGGRDLAGPQLGLEAGDVPTDLLDAGVVRQLTGGVLEAQLEQLVLGLGQAV